MTSTELRERLEKAERSAHWLADKMDMSHTQVYRWLNGDPIPDKKAVMVNRLLIPVVKPKEEI